MEEETGENIGRKETKKNWNNTLKIKIKERMKEKNNITTIKNRKWKEERMKERILSYKIKNGKK